MIANKKMKSLLAGTPKADIGDLESLAFSKLGEGYFFEREVNANVRAVAKMYGADASSDWARYEYTTNKIHLEDEIEASIPELAAIGVKLVQSLADKFKATFPSEKAVFWLACDEFGEYPSVTLSFYVKREGMLPLLSEDEASLDSFDGALLLVI